MEHIVWFLVVLTPFGLMDQFVFHLKSYALHFLPYLTLPVPKFSINILFYAFHLDRVSGPLRKCHLLIKFAIRRTWCRGGAGEHAAGCCHAARPSGRSAALAVAGAGGGVQHDCCVAS